MTAALAQSFAIIRANLGPLAVAFALLVAARLIDVQSDPAAKGLTWAALSSTTLEIAGYTLATLVGCWAVVSGGRPAGLAGLRGRRVAACAVAAEPATPVLGLRASLVLR